MSMFLFLYFGKIKAHADRLSIARSNNERLLFIREMNMMPNMMSSNWKLTKLSSIESISPSAKGREATGSLVDGARFCAPSSG